MSAKRTILLSGMIAADPGQGGATWAVLQYLLGFKRLGHDVYFVEPVPEASLRPPGASLAQSDNAAYFQRVTAHFGRPDCPVPPCGLLWIPTLQPVVLAHWPVAAHITYDALTTIGNWRGYGSIEHQGVFYGQKAHSLRQFFTLPTRTKENFVLALAIHPDEGKDLAALAGNAWRLLGPARVASPPAGYQRFVQGSK